MNEVFKIETLKIDLIWGVLSSKNRQCLQFCFPQPGCGGLTSIHGHIVLAVGLRCSASLHRSTSELDGGTSATSCLMQGRTTSSCSPISSYSHSETL